MKDLGVPGGQNRGSESEAPAETRGVTETRPDLSGSGLGEAVAPLPSVEELTRDVALPSAEFPSDHVSLCADLAWRD